MVYVFPCLISYNIVIIELLNIMNVGLDVMT